MDRLSITNIKLCAEWEYYMDAIEDNQLDFEWTDGNLCKEVLQYKNVDYFCIDGYKTYIKFGTNNIILDVQTKFSINALEDVLNNIFLNNRQYDNNIRVALTLQTDETMKLLYQTNKFDVYLRLPWAHQNKEAFYICIQHKNDETEDKQ